MRWEDPLEKEMATCSSILPWKTDGPRSLAGPGDHNSVRHNLETEQRQSEDTHQRTRQKTKACLKSDFMGIIKSQKVSHE